MEDQQTKRSNALKKPFIYTRVFFGLMKWTNPGSFPHASAAEAGSFGSNLAGPLLAGSKRLGKGLGSFQQGLEIDDVAENLYKS